MLKISKIQVEIFSVIFLSPPLSLLMLKGHLSEECSLSVCLTLQSVSDAKKTKNQFEMETLSTKAPFFFQIEYFCFAV